MKTYWTRMGAVFGSYTVALMIIGPEAVAQSPVLPPDSIAPPRRELQPGLPLADPREELPQLEDLFPPPEDDTLDTPPAEGGIPLPEANDVLTFTTFRLEGSQAFEDDSLTTEIQAQVPLPSDRPASLPELALIIQETQAYYRANDALLSGLTVEAPRIEGDEVVLILQVEEWEIGTIDVQGLQRLQPGYVASRLALAAESPINVRRLQEALRLLQQDPLIESFDAVLRPGLQADRATLSIDVREASTLAADLGANNNRSESIGSGEWQVQLQENNLLGFGDRIALSYGGTDGSRRLGANYTVPVSPRNTTLTLSYATSDSTIIQPPFDVLDIESTSRYYDLTLRHPVWQTSEQEVALGLTLSRWETESQFLEGILGQPIPFPSLGSDGEGRTRLSVVRFFQEWTQRSRNSVLGVRSQFNLGLDAFDATINPNPNEPDGQFFSWQGQGQYLQLLAPDTLLILRGSVQLGDRPLVPLEQFALGGVGTVRGYRRDTITTDSGLLLSAEVPIPILRIPELGNGILQIAPFADFGYAWNRGSTSPTLSTLAAVGFGLRWQSTGIGAQVEWGIPLTRTQFGTSNLRDSSLRFSININPF